MWVYCIELGPVDLTVKRRNKSTGPCERMSSYTKKRTKKKKKCGKKKDVEKIEKKNKIISSRGGISFVSKVNCVSLAYLLRRW